MSYCFYDGIALSHTKLVHHAGTVRLDASNNYLYTEYRLTVAGIYNPEVNAYLVSAAGVPQVAPGAIAPQTESALRHRLSQPRRPFGFVVSDWLMLYGPTPLGFRGSRRANVRTIDGGLAGSGGLIREGAAGLFEGGGVLGGVLSPRPARRPLGTVAALAMEAAAALNVGSVPVVRYQFARVDVANGPFPSPPEVLENVGDKTFMVRFTVTLSLNETPADLGTQGGRVPRNFPTSPLLGNSYAVTDVVDQDFFTSRFVEGTAVFRSDALQVLNMYPDQLRYWLSLPVPARFRREQIKVRQEADGVTTHYSFVDRERVLNFDPNVFTRVEAVIRRDTDQPGLESILRAGVPALQGLLGGGLGAIERFLRRSPLTSRFSRMFGGLLGAAGTLAAGAAVVAYAAYTAGIPVTNYRVIGRFWGHARQNRTFFETTAANVLRNLISNYGILMGLDGAYGFFRIPPGIPIIGGNFYQLGDLRTHVTADVSGMFVEIEWEAIGSRLQSFLGSFLPVLAAAADGERRDRPIPPRQVQAILIDPMRGTYTGAAVASALRDAAQPWAQTGLAPTVVDREVDRSGTYIYPTGRPGGFTSFPDGTSVTDRDGTRTPSRPGATLP